MAHKRIVHGYGDPFEIPQKCMTCGYYDRNGSDFPRCRRREDGKLIPKIDNMCFISKEGFERLQRQKKEEEKNNEEELE